MWTSSVLAAGRRQPESVKSWPPGAVACVVFAVVALLMRHDAMAEIAADVAMASDSGSPSVDISPMSDGTPTAAWDQHVLHLLEQEAAPAAFRTIATLLLLALVPMTLLMTTGFVRISIVLGLLRQALGASMFLSHQVMMVLAFTLTVIVMLPVWQRSYQDGLRPWMEEQPGLTLTDAWNRGWEPLQAFICRQIEASGNTADVHMLLEYSSADTLIASSENVAELKDVPPSVLLPAFLISELKTGFLIGFRIYLPFLVIDLIVSTLATALSMSAFSPTAVALPLKIIVFVMADGWHLLVGTLLQSFGIPHV